ncbi:MAG TPA: hypothetical protein VJ746_17415 [Nitrospira sp.]|nr:hypothetical protein [Nitrospira sp.]
MRLTERASAVVESYYANQAGSSTISASGNARWDGAAAYLIYDVTKEWDVRGLTGGEIVDYDPRLRNKVLRGFQIDSRVRSDAPCT